MRGHLNGRVILIFSVNKRSSAGFLVENLEQCRYEPLKNELSQRPGKMRHESHTRGVQLCVMEPIGDK